MALVTRIVEELIRGDLAVLLGDDVRDPTAADAAVRNLFLNTRLQGRILDILHAAVIHFLKFLRNHGDGDSLFQNRNSDQRNRNCLCLGIKLRAYRHGILGRIDKLHIRAVVAVIADRRILARRHIGRCKGMRMALGRHDARLHHRVIQRGRNLADTAARLQHNLAVLVSTGRLVAALQGAVTCRVIKRELLADL